MQRLLVTGGAGFIGSNFVHYVTARTPTTTSRSWTSSPTPAIWSRSTGLPGDRFRFVQGDICDAALVDGLVAGCDVVVHYAAESHNDNSLHDPRPFLRHEHHRHVHADRGGPEARQALPPHLHRRGLRRPRARRSGAVHREHAVQPVQPVLVHQGRLGPAGPGLGAVLRAAGDDQQLLQQLRPVPARGEVHSAPDHQRDRRDPPEAVRQGRERPRLDPRR